LEPPDELVVLLERVNALREERTRSRELLELEARLEREHRTSRRLAVYGSLAPGQRNHGRVRDPRGTWEPATVRGELHPQGWGAALGFPGLTWRRGGGEVPVQLLTSALLPRRWAALDRFEGPGYRRVLVPVATAGGIVVANLYEIRSLRDEDAGLG